MINDYLHAAMHRAKYEFLPNDKTYYGEIPGFYGSGTLRRRILKIAAKSYSPVLRYWILFSVSKNLPIPVLDDMSLEIKKVA